MTDPREINNACREAASGRGGYTCVLGIQPDGTRHRIVGARRRQSALEARFMDGDWRPITRAETSR